MSSKILLRRGTAAQWSSANPILGNGEVGIETDTLKIKIGNGTSTWSQLTSYANVTPSELTSAINSIIDLSPSTLDTLNELAAAINDDPNFFTTVNTSLSDKASLTSANTFTASPQQINASASTVGLIVKANATQTVDIFQVQNSSGTPLWYVNQYGQFVGNQPFYHYNIQYISTPTASLVPLTVRGAASQTANLQQWQDSTGAVSAFIDSSGRGRFLSVILGSISSSFGANLNLQTSASTIVGAIIRGNISQTANLQEWQNSSGTILTKVDSSGRITISPDTSGSNLLTANGSTTTFSVNQFGSINVIGTATSSFGASFTGTRVGISGISGIALIVKGVASGDTQQWQDISGNVVASINYLGLFNNSTSGIITKYVRLGGSSYLGTLSLTTETASTIGAVIRGSESQTANFMEFQDSSGTVLTYVTPTGHITATSSAISTLYTGGQLSTGTLGYLNASTFSASVSPIVVRGTVSQTADLQQWQNSAGTALTRIAYNGILQYNASVGDKIYLYNSEYGIGIQSYATVIFASANTLGRVSIRPGYGSGNADAVELFTSGRIKQTLTEPGSVGNIIKAAASQSANLQEWQDSSGTVLSKIDAVGAPTFGSVATSVNSKSYSSNSRPFVIYSTDGTNASERFNVEGTAGAVRMNYDGGITIIGTSGASYGGRLNVTTGSTTFVGAVIRGVASQTANLQEWQDSAGTVIAKIDANGQGSFKSTTLTASSSGGSALTLVAASGQTAPLLSAPGGTKISAGGNYLTTPGLTVSYTSDFNAGAANVTPVYIKGAASQTSDLTQWINSAGTVLSKIRSDGTIASTYFDGVAASGTYIQTAANAGISVVARVTGQVTMRILAAASQTANLTEWQDSSGTILSKVDSSGNITAPSYNLSNSLYSLRKTIKKTVGDGTAVAANTTYDLFQFNFSSSLQGTFYFQVSMRGSGYGQNLTYSLPVTYAMDWLSQGYSGNLFTNNATWVSLTPQTFSGRHLMIGDNLKLQARVSNNIIYFRLKANAALSSAGNSPYFDVYIQHSEEFAGCTITEYSTVGTDTDSQTTLANFLSSKGGTTELFNPVTIFSNSASNTPIKIKGFSSQTANLTEWQNSAGTVIASVANNGELTLKPIPFSGGVSGGIYMRDTSNSWAAGSFKIKVDNAGTPRFGFTAPNAASEALTIVGNSVGIQTESPSALFQVTSNNASNIVSIIKGYASQTANLQEWQDSAGTVLSNINSVGAANFVRLGVGGATPSTVPLFVTSPNASYIANIVRGASGQTANLQEWQNSAGNVLTVIASSGSLRITNITSIVNTGAYTNYQSDSVTIIQRVTTAVNLIVKGAASQTADLQQWQNSAGNYLVKITSDGSTYFGGGYSYFNQYGELFTTGSRPLGIGGNLFTNTVVSIQPTLSTLVGVAVRGASGQTANLQEWQDSSGGVRTAINAGGALSVNYANQAVTGSSGSGAFEVKRTAFFDTGLATNVAIIVRGRTSQTANLQEWQDSSGTPITYINSSGTIVSSAGAYIQTSNSYGIQSTAGAATTVPIIAQGDASQTANLQQWQDSSGNILSKVTSTGRIEISVNDSSRALYVGNSNASGSGLVVNANGGRIFQAQVNGTTKFYVDGTGLFRIGSAGTSPAGILHIDPSGGAGNGSQVALSIRAHSSQTADLTQWQDSTGTVLAKISAAGAIDVTAITVNGSPISTSSIPAAADVELMSIMGAY